MPVRIRIGTRGSRLALWQAEQVAERTRALLPGAECELVVIKTQGDKILDVALSRIGDKGLFTKELEQALAAGTVDMAVHSLKDLPTTLPEGMALGAVLERENPCDVLLSAAGLTLGALPVGARVGTSSLRRASQLRHLRPDLEVVSIRGNVETRVARVHAGEVDAAVLAYAGVARMGMLSEVSEVLAPELVLPAVGQGAIAVEIRRDDQEMSALAPLLNHQRTACEVAAERAYLRALEGGCQVPLGCLARCSGDRLVLQGMVGSLDGSRLLRENVEGPAESAVALGQELARRLMARGAGDILREIRCMGE
jgi:hydroxymethylbilane synthase